MENKAERFTMEAKGVSRLRLSRVARVGVAAWVVGVLWFYLAQLIVGARWSQPGYSWSTNNVSDLGNVHCQMWAEDGHAAQYVCSPLHNLMNATFILEGLVIIFGLWVIGSLWKKSISAHASRVFLTLAGAGIIVAGLAPADVSENVHVVLGAFFIFLFGNMGLLVAGKAVNHETLGGLRRLAPIFGGVGFAGGFLFFSYHYLGLGPGGMERVWGYVVPIWTFIVGGYGLYKSRTA